MFTFKSGIHPEDKKELSKDRPIRKIFASDIMVFPLSQHIGKPAIADVKVGDNVLVGQIIGKADGDFSANILSSVSGKVQAIEDRLTISGKKVQSIVVENDYKYNCIDNYNTDSDFKNFEREEIIQKVKDAGIVGFGGATFPTHIKINPENYDKIDTVLINACECEPYLTSDYRMMIEDSDMLIIGAEILLKLFTKSKVVICVEDNKIDAYKILNNKLKKYNNITSILVKTKYPQGAERQLINAVTGRKNNSTVLPANIGVIVLNVTTVIAIAYTINKNRPPLERVMTISGDGFNDTANLSVPFGTSYKKLVDEVGGLKEDAKYLISGGPMMGISLYDLDVPVAKNSSAFLAFINDNKKLKEETNCINCGRCLKSCPINLVPTRMLKAVSTNNYETFIKFNGLECIECGCCSYVCPAKKSLTQSFKYFKVATKNYLNSKKEGNNG